MTRKGLTPRKLLASAAGIGSFAIIGRPRAATPYKPSDSLIDAARKEGKFLLYTATFTEVEQEVINEFRKKFPFIRVETPRTPLMPAKAGIQFLAKPLGPRFRGDERTTEYGME